MATAFFCFVALGACTADDDDSGGAAATDAVAGATVVEGTLAPAATTAGGGTDADAPAEQPAEGEGGARSLRELVGPSIAIEARATVRAEDVRGTVDRLTAFVVRRGGRVASADVDYAPDVTSGTPRSPERRWCSPCHRASSSRSSTASRISAPSSPSTSWPRT